MQTRPVRPSDLPALAQLHRRWDTAWFGAPEHDEDEVREFVERAAPLAERSLLVLDGERIVGAAWRTATDSALLVDPDVDPAPVQAELIGWFGAHGWPVEALSTDRVLVDALVRAGWTHHHSSFELQRAVADGWRPAAPQPPDGVRFADMRPSDAPAMHRLIYVEAGWAEVPGHPERDFDQWRDIFMGDHAVPDQQVLAWQGDTLVGVATGRTFSDGAGWVAQLAVAKPMRGRGLGRALLLEAL